MRNIWTIAQREFKLYFSSPAAYMIAFMILLILGIIFYSNVVNALVFQYAPGVEIVIGPLVTLLLFGIPAITMRLIAEEQRMGTIELLLTSPIRDYELVVGKWLGAFMFILVLIAITVVFPFTLDYLVSPGIDQGPLLTGYLGIVLICAALTAIGVAVSSLFSNQIAAFFATLGVILLLWFVSMPSEAAGTTGAELIRYLDFSQHFYGTLARGILDLRNIVYYLSVTALALFAGTILVEVRRWR
ncbi:MAG: ABC transporter permease subunit [Anaerolineales bacterium]|nr:ABC transporter permease subunit [Anaerolineales bacterium]